MPVTREISWLRVTGHHAAFALIGAFALNAIGGLGIPHENLAAFLARMIGIAILPFAVATSIGTMIGLLKKAVAGGSAVATAYVAGNTIMAVIAGLMLLGTFR